MANRSMEIVFKSQFICHWLMAFIYYVNYAFSLFVSDEAYS
jgi:hypothetical protein